MRAFFLSAALVLVCPGLAGAQAAADAESWSVAGGEVRVRCRMTVGGSFDAVTSAISGTLRGEPLDPRYTGELRVDLATLDTGIELRNEHLRNSYLELGRGPEFLHAVLSGIVLAATPPASNRRHETRFSGTLTLRRAPAPPPTRGRSAPAHECGAAPRGPSATG